MNIVFKPTCDLYDEYLDVARVPTVSFLNLGGERQFCGTVVTVKCFEDNSRIKELVASGLELDACCLELDACRLFFNKLGA